MPNEQRKTLLDKFRAHLSADFEAYCAAQGQEPSANELVVFLIDRELLRMQEVQRFTVLREMQEITAQGTAPNKTQLVGQLAHRLHVSERTVWNMLKNKA